MDSEQEIEFLQERIASLEKQLSEKEEEIIKLQDYMSHCSDCQKIASLEAEIERLTHLHELDHSLADQWQKKNIALEQKLEEASKEIASLTQREENYLETVGQDTRTIKGLRLEVLLLEQKLKKAVSILSELLNSEDTMNWKATGMREELRRKVQEVLKQIGESDERN